MVTVTNEGTVYGSFIALEIGLGMRPATHYKQCWNMLDATDTLNQGEHSGSPTKPLNQRVQKAN